MPSITRARWFYLTGTILVALSAWALYRLWPRHLEFRARTMIPVWERIGNRDVLRLPGRFLIAEIGHYNNELFAYMMFTYLRARPPFQSADFLLTYRRDDRAITYLIQAQLPNDLLAAVKELSAAQAAGLIEEGSWRFVTKESLDHLREETRVFQAAYNHPPVEGSKISAGLN